MTHRSDVTDVELNTCTHAFICSECNRWAFFWGDLRHLIRLEVAYQEDMRAWENTWWSRTDYALAISGADHTMIPPDGQPLPVNSNELRWFVSDWEGAPPRTVEQRIADLLESRDPPADDLEF